MSEVKNGRIMVPIMEADGMARVVTSGQVVCLRADLLKKLDRYIRDPRFDDATREMYKRQREDVLAEMEAVNNG
jgi:hypothetical protein